MSQQTIDNPTYVSKYQEDYQKKMNEIIGIVKELNGILNRYKNIQIQTTDKIIHMLKKTMHKDSILKEFTTKTLDYAFKLQNLLFELLRDLLDLDEKFNELLNDSKNEILLNAIKEVVDFIEDKFYEEADTKMLTILENFFSKESKPSKTEIEYVQTKISNYRKDIPERIYNLINENNDAMIGIEKLLTKLGENINTKSQEIFGNANQGAAEEPVFSLMTPEQQGLQQQRQSAPPSRLPALTSTLPPAASAAAAPPSPPSPPSSPPASPPPPPQLSLTAASGSGSGAAASLGPQAQQPQLSIPVGTALPTTPPAAPPAAQPRPPAGLPPAGQPSKTGSLSGLLSVGRTP